MAHFRRVHRDANHLPIVRDLKRLGYSVGDLAMVGSHFPDLIVASSRVTALIELKLPTGKFRLGQLEFLATWKGVAGFAETLDDCVNLMEDPGSHGLSWGERQIILNIVQKAKAVADARKSRDPIMRVTAFEKLFKAAKEVKGL